MKRKSRSNTFTVVLLLSLGLAVIVAIFLAVKFMGGSKNSLQDVKTQNNLRQLGNALVGYKNANNSWPDDLSALADAKITPDVFLVAGSKTQVPADWASLSAAARAKWINDNSDFIYSKPPANARGNYVMAYIKPELSPDTNNLLMSDNRVEHLDEKNCKAVIDDLKAGKNPPPSFQP